MDAAAVGSEGGQLKTLTLSLKKQWFDMIKSGVKKEEYDGHLAQSCLSLNFVKLIIILVL